MFYFQTLLFLLFCFLEPWYCCSEWQMWRMNDTTREKLVKKKGPMTPLLYLLFTVPITLLPCISWCYRPVLSGLLLTAYLGSHIWIGWPCQGTGVCLAVDWPVAAGSSCRCDHLNHLMERHTLIAQFSTYKHLYQRGRGRSGGCG